MGDRLLATGTYSRFSSSLADFKDSTKLCSVCQLMMSALRDRDASLFNAANEFENNSGPSYDSYAGTDIEGSRGKKVSITLNAKLVMDLEGSVTEDKQYSYLQLAGGFEFGRRRKGSHGGSKSWIVAYLVALGQEGMTISETDLISQLMVYVDSDPEVPHLLLGPDTWLSGDQKTNRILAWLQTRKHHASSMEQGKLPRQLLDVSDSAFVRLTQLD